MKPVKRQTAYLVYSKSVLSGDFVRREGWEPNYVASSVGMLSRVMLTGLITEKFEKVLTLDDGSAKIQLRFFNVDVVPDILVGDPVLVVGRPRDYSNERFVTVELVRKLPSVNWLVFFNSQKEICEKYVPSNPVVNSSLVNNGGGSPSPSFSSSSSALSDSSSASSVSSKKSFLDKSAPPGVDANSAAVGRGVEMNKDASMVSGSVDNSNCESNSDSSSNPVNKAQIIISAIRELDAGDGAPTEDVLEKVGFDDAESKLQFLISEGEVFELRAGKIKVLE